MFYFYGGKRRLANFYAPPVHKVVVEPFAGSAAYSIRHLQPRKTKPPLAQHAILVEKDPRVCALWTRLLAMSPEEILNYSIPEAGERTRDFLVMTAACSNRIARTKEMTVTERMPVVVRRMLKQIAAALPHVQGRVEIVQGDYTKAPDIEATWFIDPPYHVNGRPQSRGMGYAENCNSHSLDYEALADWCRERRGQKIVCEQKGATWLPFEYLRHARNSIGNKTAEVVWNGSPATSRELERDLGFAPVPAPATA